MIGNLAAYNEKFYKLSNGTKKNMLSNMSRGANISLYNKCAVCLLIISECIVKLGMH